MKNLETLMVDTYGFHQMSPQDAPIFRKYQEHCIFFDVCFTNFWAWNGVFHFTWKMVGDALIVVYTDLDHTPTAIVLPGPSGDIRAGVDVLHGIFCKIRSPLLISFVPPEWLPRYDSIGYRWQATYDEAWSDYVYEVADFLNLEGGANKSKRRELKLVQDLGDVKFCSLETLGGEGWKACMEVFESWCQWHSCETCVFGCERQAFAALKRIWGDQFYGGVVYLEGKPVAFALGETLGGVACYSFQKNIGRYRGLTYYLSYHCASLPHHPSRLNWCEDMGLEGLRLNKMRYRPSERVPKYTVHIIAHTEKRMDSSI